MLHSNREEKIKQTSTACSKMIQIKVLQQPTYTVTSLHPRTLATVCLKTVTVNGRRRRKKNLQCGGCENETWWRRVWHCHCACSVTAGLRSGSLLVTTAKQKSMENKFQGKREGGEKHTYPQFLPESHPRLTGKSHHRPWPWIVLNFRWILVD